MKLIIANAVKAPMTVSVPPSTAADTAVAATANAATIDSPIFRL